MQNLTREAISEYKKISLTSQGRLVGCSDRQNVTNFACFAINNKMMNLNEYFS